jgi:23S rRNA (guanosine2251-2'-O)-methyltransferase
MKDRNLWIWGLHSIEAALDECADLILEIKIEESALQVSSRQQESSFDQQLSKLKSFQKRAKAEGIRCEVVRELPKEYRDKRTQGCVAMLKRAPSLGPRDLDEALKSFEKESATGPRQWALLDRIEDPRNFGAILRSAAAFGLKGVFFSDRQQSPITGVVAQASAGQCFRVSLYELSNLNQSFKVFEDQKILKVVVAALDMDGQPLENFVAEQRNVGVSDIIWLLGSEGRGLRPGLLEKATHRVSIPMEAGVESLNVSVASALAFYAVHKKS